MSGRDKMMTPKVTGGRSIDRDNLENLIWERRPSRAFGWDTLPQWLDVIIESLFIMHGEPNNLSRADEFWAFVLDQAPQDET